MSRRLRRAAVAIAAVVAVACACYVAVELYRARDYGPWFVEHKGKLAVVDVTEIGSEGSATTYRLALADDRGLRFEAHLRVPRSAATVHPVVIILGGLGTGKRTLDYLGPGTAMLLALDYPYHGKKRGLSRTEFLLALPAMRRAILDTVPAVMLAVDYLWQRPDVDRSRVLLAGGSFGALFAPAAAAAEPRVSALALFFGAGDLHGLLRHNMPVGGPARGLLAWIGAAIVSPLEPLKYIDRVAPRPVFLLNGTEDPVMPEHNSRLLHGKAREPKSVRWVPLAHVNVRSSEFRQLIFDELLGWLIEIDFVAADEADTFLRPQPDVP